ncbi:MAG TPA: alcohol dehydrogenase catalytic domain-containing protein [Terriglobia bacterium]|nr:alcohol dehydrogenase catalytic domain-containing protein [Terriglobia bacterium]
MKALLLEDARKMAVRRVPDPAVPPHEVLIGVRAVGVCGTDFHLFQGDANYHRDARGRLIPLTEQPQILGHEFSGEVLELGRDVKDLRPGDRVLCDQGRHCRSEGRRPLCPYCASGESHQCDYYQEHGITGLAGALADYIAIPAVSCLRVPEEMTWEEAALVEPLACVLHSCDRAERASARFRFDASGGGSHGDRSIRNVLICGAGPAGLLFLQYLRNVQGFEGLILVADLRAGNLKLAQAMGGTPVNVAERGLVEAVREHTAGQRIHYLIEASGSAAIFREIPALLRRQGTVLIYGIGHKGHDTSVLGPMLFLEPTLVAAVGASGGSDADGRPTTYRRALEMVSSGKVKALPFVTHRYHSLENVHLAFEKDFQRQDYIKGVLDLS